MFPILTAVVSQAWKLRIKSGNQLIVNLIISKLPLYPNYMSWNVWPAQLLHVHIFVQPCTPHTCCESKAIGSNDPMVLNG